MSSPTVMELKMPEKENDSIDYQDVSSRLTVVLLKDNMIYGYYGNNIRDGRSIMFKEIRSLIVEGVKRYTKDSLVVVIKPDKEATYKNSVDMLDEMTINHIEKYSMTDLNKQEKEFLKIAE